MKYRFKAPVVDAWKNESASTPLPSWLTLGKRDKRESDGTVILYIPPKTLVCDVGDWIVLKPGCGDDFEIFTVRGPVFEASYEEVPD